MFGVVVPVDFQNFRKIQRKPLLKGTEVGADLNDVKMVKDKEAVSVGVLVPAPASIVNFYSPALKGIVDMDVGVIKVLDAGKVVGV